MSDEINACLVNMEEIPASVVATFKPGPIPIVLQLHNRRIQNRFEPNRAGELLKEKIAEIMGNCGVLPRAIIIDDLNLALSGGYGRSFEEKLHAFAPTYAGLTIVIQCPHDVAKSRYMQDSRCIEIDSDRFEAEIRRDNALHEELRRQGVVVTTVNGNTLTADETYQTLLKRLDEFPLWGFLIGKYR
ncbi:hypothetical protein GGS24DRAFT_508012 [Hypoxylon argillaceum]|nr:hypothetical protein GGS24DRAFT_508012 [Hypoxylon argillaceum]